MAVDCPGVTDEDRAIAEMVKDFTADNITPHSLEWDKTKHFPEDVLRQAAELGIGGIYTKEEFGGSGLTRTAGALIFDQMAYGCPAVSAYLSIHNMVTWMIDEFGTQEQRAEYVEPLTSMEHLSSYLLTEPDAGSDAASLKTKAVKDGDHYVLDGMKQFISGAGSSDIYLVMARTGEAGPKGISTFIVRKDDAGLSFGANEYKMGWNAQPTRQVIFDKVRIPADRLLGGVEGQGFSIAMKGLNGGRINIAACSLGGARAAYDKAVEYLRDRQAFGGPLIKNPALQFRLADMATKLRTAQLMLFDAAAALDKKTPDYVERCAMAKLYVTDTCFEVADMALQLHGGYGYLHEYGVEKIVRDLRVHRILEGTNEIMRVIMGRSIAAGKI